MYIYIYIFTQYYAICSHYIAEQFEDGPEDVIYEVFVENINFSECFRLHFFRPNRRKDWAKKVAAYMPDEERTGDQARFSWEVWHLVTRDLHHIGLQDIDLAIPDVACLKSRFIARDFMGCFFGV